MANALRLTHYPVQPGQSLAAYLPPTLDRCGVYVLHFDDGLYYVGQATDVVRRFTWHRRHQPRPIVGISYGPVPKQALSDIERRTVRYYEEAGHRLRNIDLVGLPQGDSKLDVIISPAEQKAWLDGEPELGIGARGTLARQRVRTRPRFEKLAAHPAYEDIREALAHYVYFVIPAAHETEQIYWSMTSMPSTNRSKQHQRLAAISINNVEVLVFFDDETNDGQRFSGGFLNLAMAGDVDLPEDFGVDVETDERGYKATGPVRRLYFYDPHVVPDLLAEPAVLAAARRFAMGLMRKGSGMFARFHDFHLTDHVFAYIEEQEEETRAN